MKDHYPKIKFPYELVNLSKSLPTILSNPEFPIKPIKENFVKPSDNYDEPIGCMSLGFISFLISGIGVLIFKAGFEFGGFFVVIGGFILIYAIFGAKSIEENQKKKKDLHLQAVNNYNKNIRNAEIIYNQNLKNYEQKKNEYENDCKKTEELNLELQSEKNILNYRNQKIRNFFIKAKKPQLYNNYLQKGVTQTYFKNHLIQKFEGQVYENYSFNNLIYENLVYIPDYVIFNKSLNLFINIEIDEPYIGIDGTPIHYKESNDEVRDELFLRKRWIVIRFAEIQIIKNPTECVELISTIINNLKKSICDDISNQFSIEPIQNWSKEDSYKLGFNKFRNCYLPKELQILLETETLTIEKENLNPKINYFNGIDDLPF
jgi:hypothetical protein